MPKITTMASAMPRSLAIGASCAVDIRPPAATRKNIRYITQKIGERSACDGGTSSAPCATLMFVIGTVSLASGALMKFEITTMMTP